MPSSLSASLYSSLWLSPHHDHAAKSQVCSTSLFAALQLGVREGLSLRFSTAPGPVVQPPDWILLATSHSLALDLIAANRRACTIVGVVTWGCKECLETLSRPAKSQSSSPLFVLGSRRIFATAMSMHLVMPPKDQELGLKLILMPNVMRGFIASLNYPIR